MVLSTVGIFSTVGIRVEGNQCSYGGYVEGDLEYSEGYLECSGG